MNRGFSIIECVIYLIAVVLIFSILNEFIFKFYLNVNKEIKSIQFFTKYLLNFNTIVNDMRKSTSIGGIKKIDSNSVIFNINSDNIMYSLKEGNLIRQLLRFNENKIKAKKSISLMMKDVVSFDINPIYFKEAQAGFRVSIMGKDKSHNFSHNIALQGGSSL